MDYQTIVNRVNQILTQYPYALTLRQIYYRLLPTIPNTRSSYNTLSKILVKARENGEVDENKIEDRTRTTIGGDDGYSDPKSFAKSMIKDFLESPKYYARKMWENQDHYIEVWVEKDALSRVISTITDKFNVRTAPSKGYAGYTYIKDAVRRLPVVPVCKTIVILHFSDHDPSGLDMTRDLEKRFLKYLCLEYKEEFDEKEFDADPEYWKSHHNPFDFQIKRIALTFNQVKQYNLPPNPTKLADTRSPLYIGNYGNKCWELDALEPSVLQSVVEQTVRQFIDTKKWNRTVKEMDKERKTLERKFKRFKNKLT